MRPFVIVILAVVAVIAGWKLLYPTYTYRYRMTVNVVVDEEVHSGASVIEVSHTKIPFFMLPQGPYWTRVSGDAIFLDLGSNRNVVALLTSGFAGLGVSYVQFIAPKRLGFSLDDFEQRRAIPMAISSELSVRDFPTFISFADLNDPKSAREVRSDQFEQILGRGVTLRDVTIELTNDPVTRGIEQKLNWWRSPGRPALDALQSAGLASGSAIDAESVFERK